VFNGSGVLADKLVLFPDAIQPSDTIAEMAKKARDVYIRSKTYEWLWCHDPRFSEILHPKRMRSARADENALERWQHEFDAIILQATEMPLIGPDHES
jgi:hypothetical protein